MERKPAALGVVVTLAVPAVAMHQHTRARFANANHLAVHRLDPTGPHLCQFLCEELGARCVRSVFYVSGFVRQTTGRVEWPSEPSYRDSSG